MAPTAEQNFAHFAHIPLLAAERFCRRPGPRRDEFFSEASLAMVRALSRRLPGIRNTEAYLFGVTYRACVDLWRSQRRALKSANGAAWLVEDQRNPAVGHLLEIADLNRKVMCQLTPRQRRIVRAISREKSLNAIAVREKVSRQTIFNERNCIRKIANQLMG